MEFNIDRAPFLRALSRLQTVVERRNTKPVLGNVLLEATPEEIILSATNLEVSLRTQCPADVVEPGSLTVNAKTLYEVIKELPNEIIRLRKDARERLRLNCGRARFEMAVISADQFPQLPQPTDGFGFEVNHGLLTEMLDKTHFAVSYDETRFALNGVQLQLQAPQGEGTGSIIRMAATDTHRLAMVERILEAEPAEENLEIIIPKKAVHEVRRVLEEVTETVQIIITESHFQLIHPEVTLVSNLVEGRFPDFNRVLPKGSPFTLDVDREELLGVVKRMSVLSHEKSRGIRMEVDGQHMKFDTNNPEQEVAEEEMLVSLEGGNKLSVGFNARYLKEILSVMEGDNIRFSISDNEKLPVLVSDPTQDGTLYVLMPMRI